MPYLFTPPSVARPAGTDQLWSRFRCRVGQALLKKDGFYTLAEVILDEDLASSDNAYLGGHIYLVSDAEAASLTAAGYGSGLTARRSSGLGAFGAGKFGAGKYGEGDPESPDPGGDDSDYGDGVVVHHGTYGDGPYGDGIYEGG